MPLRIPALRPLCRHHAIFGWRYVRCAPESCRLASRNGNGNGSMSSRYLRRWCRFGPLLGSDHRRRVRRKRSGMGGSFPNRDDFVLAAVPLGVWSCCHEVTWATMRVSRRSGLTVRKRHGRRAAESEVPLGPLQFDRVPRRRIVSSQVVLVTSAGGPKGRFVPRRQVWVTARSSCGALRSSTCPSQGMNAVSHSGETKSWSGPPSIAFPQAVRLLVGGAVGLNSCQLSGRASWIAFSARGSLYSCCARGCAPGEQEE